MNNAASNAETVGENEASRLVEMVRANADRVNKASRERSNFIAELIDRSRAIESDIAALSEQSEGAQQDLRTTADAAKQIISEVESIVGLMDKTVSGIVALDQRVSQFESSFREVRDISKTIKDVADQTNILSLNAMIEAANAGENGHGFKVVANEVRELASVTGRSAQNISESINRLFSDAGEMSKDCAALRDLSGQSAERGKANLSGLRTIHEDVLHSASHAQTANQSSAEQISQFASLLMGMEDLQRDTESAIEGSAKNIDLATKLEACIVARNEPGNDI
ncbi:methyl-accepting chemotaxis protein [Erythrobacter sp. W53]|uniref:methyl-accepting chemotaxis protein n=1 Tax=Erythrobacter sp. W53 TaxID=3425947 RepID=UPI003D766AB4